MVKFDSNHKSIDGQINEKKGRKVLKKILATGLIVANLATFSGCALADPCEIEEPHAHFYVSPYTGIGRYIESERLHKDDLVKTDQYIAITPENRELLEFTSKHHLFKISDNEEALKEIEANRTDYMEYEHREAGWRIIPFFAPRYRDKWSSDAEVNRFTGDTRLTHHVYRACKLVPREDGKYEIIHSDYADSVFDLEPEYEYIPLYYSLTQKIQDGEIVKEDYDMGVKDNGIYVGGRKVDYDFDEEITYTEQQENGRGIRL